MRFIFFVRFERFFAILPSTIAELCKMAQGFLKGCGVSIQELLFIFQSRD